MEIGVIGTSIWQQNLSLLEKLTVDRNERGEVLNELKRGLGIDELIYLSTCNRVEFIYSRSGESNASQLLHKLLDFFFRRNKSISFFPNDFFHFTGKEAITHIFRTVSSLESMVMGENQITGQFKEAHAESLNSGLAGPVLNRLAQEALLVAKKVKSQTMISEGALSVASLAADEIKLSLEGIDHPIVAIIGSGPMQRKMATYVNDKLLGALIFISRTAERAQKLAEEYGGSGISLEEFKADPPECDAIVSSTAASEPVFNSGFLGKLNHRNKATVCVDLAIPRDFSTDFIDHDKINYIDIQYLKSKNQGNLRQKFIEAGKANAIIRDSINAYLTDTVELHLRPIFRECFDESMEQAKKMMQELFDNRITGLSEKDEELILKTVAKAIGHSTFGPIKKISAALVEKKSEIEIEPHKTIKRKAL